jgi:hypothetical protein
MYSPSVTERQVALLESKIGRKLMRTPVARVEDLSAHLASLVDSSGKLKRPLTTEERLFVADERLLGKLDWLYWARRYATIEFDGTEGGGIGHFRMWPSQQLVHDLICKLEEEAFTSWDKGFPSDGICVCQSKNRQLGATMHWRVLIAHRVLNWKHARGFSASIDDSKVHELYKRDQIIYTNLPWYMKPRLGIPNTLDAAVSFADLHSYISYQKASQESGLGTGQQYDVAHLTEVAQWDNPERIRLDFFDTLPLSPYTLAGLESVPMGRGNWWHDFTEEVRRGEHRRWHWIFVPSYVLAKKYSAVPPTGWNPAEQTLLHAKKVAETSPDFVGRRVELTKEQLYWFETERRSAQKAGELNLFLTNHAPDPESSFQHSGQSAFDIELMETLRNRSLKGVPYRFERFEDASRLAHLARLRQ